MRICLLFLKLFVPALLVLIANNVAAEPLRGIKVGTFPADIHQPFSQDHGLPSNNVTGVAVTTKGEVFAATDKGLARYSNGRWKSTPGFQQAVEHIATDNEALLVVTAGQIHRIDGMSVETLGPAPSKDVRALVVADRLLLGSSDGLFEQTGHWQPVQELTDLVGTNPEIRQLAVAADGRIAVAAKEGLFLFDKRWQSVTPRDNIWFGTKIGAIRFDGSNWSYRQGRRWLPEDHVQGIAADKEGKVWFATPAGAGRLESQAMTLSQKAKLFEDEIDKYHRRTPYGYVLEVSLDRPGDKTSFKQHDSDNDGLWTAMYGAGECFAYAATKDPTAKRRAKAAFEALRFLSEVTQGGSHPAPRGFPARSILPTSGKNPNAEEYTPEKDRANQTDDPLWKVISPRWPTSADGKWYWKCDTSSDELDGHFFQYAAYYDLVADSKEEKGRVREVVTAIVDHLIENDFDLIDHDGQPTRWGRFGPKSLNHDPIEFGRGLNSLSILSYLQVAIHMTGAEKYKKAYDHLVKEHAYATNVLEAKRQNGVGSGNMSDDEMAIMCFYNLLKYETDPRLKELYAFAFQFYWKLMEPALNPLFNYLYAAHFLDDATGRSRAPESCLAESADTLCRFPLDRIRWSYKNSHRLDVVLLSEDLWDFHHLTGHRRDGRVLPIDERFIQHWNHHPWRLDEGGDGREMADGAAFLLPYYVGLYHAFIVK